MLFLGIASIFMIGLLINAYRESKRSHEAMLATFCHCDMHSKLWEMFHDPLTTEEDWQQMLPIAQWADEWWHRTHPGMEIGDLTPLVVHFMT